MRDVYGLFVHGVGTQSAGYSIKAQEHLAKGLYKRGIQLYAREVLWAPLMDLRSKAFMQRIEKQGHAANMLTNLFVNTFSDATSYRADNAVTTQIQYLIDYEIAKLRGVPLYIFAHSLGGLIMSDYLTTRNMVRPQKFVTFGCNIPIFCLGQPYVCPPQLLGPTRWWNYFDHEDMLGYPLHEEPGMQHVRDRGVSTGGLAIGNTGLSHITYFNDASFWEKTVAGDL